MKIVNLGVGCTFGLLVFVTADSLGMVQIADCHSFSFLVLKSFEGNDNQLLFSIQERLQRVSKKRTSEKSQFFPLMPLFDRKNMKYLLATLLTSIITTIVHAGEISGTVLGHDKKTISGATVVLCDQGSGAPISSQSLEPCAGFRMYMTPNGFALSTTDENGNFIFEDIPQGQYRLVAQSWVDKPSVQNIFDTNGKEITLHGIATEISVPSKDAKGIEITPLGTASVAIDEKFPNDGSLLVISTQPSSIDPVLGPVSWQGPFLQNMIGANRMLSGFTKINGLPAGTIHLSVFSIDNTGGCGAGSVEAKSGETVDAEYIPIVCSWSNGRHTPPRELEETFSEIKSIAAKEKNYVIPFLDQLLDQKGIPVEKDEKSRNPMSAYYPHLNQIVSLPSGRDVQFADVLASIQYIQLQTIVERRK